MFLCHSFKSIINKVCHILCWTALLLLIATTKIIAQNSDYRYGYELVSKVVFSNREIINQLLMDLFIPEDSVSSIEIFDVDKNGLTEGDLMRVMPSQNVYNMTSLSKELIKIFTELEPDSSFEMVGFIVNIADTGGTLEERLLRQLVKAVTLCYPVGNSPIKFYFEQNDDGTYKFVLFDYNSESLINPIDHLSPNLGDIIKLIYENFYEEFKDFLPMVVIVNKIIKDTIYVPVKPPTKK